jgi:hypothetical protein
MLSKLLVAWGLTAICVATHAVGVAVCVRWLRRVELRSRRVSAWAWIFAKLAGGIIFLHLFEIVVWGLAYAWRGAMPDLASGVYFSAVTYTTTGYGDLVLPTDWRLVGAIEALTGILMCGWSTGFFFAVVSKMTEPSAR